MLFRMQTVVVGMSGGVDSSVAALLLKEQGYRVIGLFMKNWEETDAQGVCLASKDFDDATRVCDQIGIPFYSVNFTQEYWDAVFSQFLHDLSLGHTPNPDILCNREIKFKVLLDKALQLGAAYLATGHYCQIEDGRLLRGRDPNKDQSYFLYTLGTPVLGQVLFPVGGLDKSAVRRLAASRGLATAQKKDSTGICFIGKRSFKPFVQRYLAFQPGHFETPEGVVVGTHDGSAYYTLGQRRGLGIGGAGEAWFVVAKDHARNVVIVAQGADHPALYKDRLTATEVSWVAGAPPASPPFPCTAKIRYRQPDEPCVVEHIEKDRVHVRFARPQRAITPRQAVVFYAGDVCLGGALIAGSE
jgi:tRNA-specific 2-thiouridylase